MIYKDHNSTDNPDDVVVQFTWRELFEKCINDDLRVVRMIRNMEDGDTFAVVQSLRVRTSAKDAKQMLEVMIASGRLDLGQS